MNNEPRAGSFLKQRISLQSKYLMLLIYLVLLPKKPNLTRFFKCNIFLKQCFQLMFVAQVIFWLFSSHSIGHFYRWVLSLLLNSSFWSVNFAPVFLMTGSFVWPDWLVLLMIFSRQSSLKKYITKILRNWLIHSTDQNAEYKFITDVHTVDIIFATFTALKRSTKHYRATTNTGFAITIE